MTALMMLEEREREHKKKHPREFNKDVKTQKAPRMTCTVCWKPAVRYYLKKYDKDGKLIERRMVYEHRDEPPITVWKRKGKNGKTFRRCHSGLVTEGLPFIEETKPVKPKLKIVKENELSEEQKQVIEIGRKQKESAAPEPDPDYKRLYFEQLSKYEKLKRKLLGLTTEL